MLSHLGVRHNILGFVTIGAILALLLTSRVAAVVALAGVPVLTALLAGFGPMEIGDFVGDGLGGVVGTATMFIFAIAYFGVMRDAGMFDPVIRRIVAWAGNAPGTITVATVALAAVAHLDGAGATTFLITIPAMMPLYDRLGMSRLTLTVCVGMGAGVMNLLPWGGPTARAASAIGSDANELWVPLIPAQGAGLVSSLVIAWFLGSRERRRLDAHTAGGTGTGRVGFADAPRSGHSAVAAGGSGSTVSAGAGAASVEAPPLGAVTDPLALSEEEQALRRPRLLGFNAALTMAVVAALVVGIAPPELIFLMALVLALVVNYPGLAQQTARIEAHATGAMLMATTLLAAGAFLGIISGTGMIDAMAVSAAQVVPAQLMPALPLIVGAVGVPLSMLFGPDAYYFRGDAGAGGPGGAARDPGGGHRSGLDERPGDRRLPDQPAYRLVPSPARPRRRRHRQAHQGVARLGPADQFDHALGRRRDRGHPAVGRMSGHRRRRPDQGTVQLREKGVQSRRRHPPTVAPTPHTRAPGNGTGWPC